MFPRRAWLVVALALAACGDRKATPPPPTAAIVGSPKVPTAVASVVPKKTTTLITAVVDSWTSTNATMQLWRRVGEENGLRTWRAVGPEWPAVVGKSGSAWGVGLHGNGAPNREGPTKKEGDGKSPAGVFAIRGAYGVAEEPPKGSKLPYETTKEGDWECVDDPGSEHYAQIIDRKAVASDWESSEQLLRDDAFYTWIVDIAHNPERVRGKGSCIFLHVWGGKDSTTVGCTAMEESQLVRLITELDPKDEPVFVLLPDEDYKELAPTWGLPVTRTVISPTP